MYLEVTTESTIPSTQNLLTSTTSKTYFTQNPLPIRFDKGFCFQFQDFLVRKTTKI